MERFADLLDRLILTPSRNAKLTLLANYFRTTPDPDRGWALAALTGDLDLPAVKPAMLRALVAEQMDEVLFAYSYDYVGDLAETIALVWHERDGARASPALAETKAPSPALPRKGGEGLPQAGTDRSNALAEKPSPLVGEGWEGGTASAAGRNPEPPRRNTP